MAVVFQDLLLTPIGAVRCWLESDSDGPFKGVGRFAIDTLAHRVRCQLFEIGAVRAQELMPYEISRGWRWFIQKTGDEQEGLTIHCRLTGAGDCLQSGPASGEHLDAIEIESPDYRIHIGTEDGEVMESRAQLSDWMPRRFSGEIGFSNSFTHYTEFGFVTDVPPLHRGEEIYFHSWPPGTRCCTTRTGCPTETRQPGLRWIN